MATPVTHFSEPTATLEEPKTRPMPNASPSRAADKRADAVRAKKKKKRAAHRVALRRSHTNG